MRISDGNMRELADSVRESLSAVKRAYETDWNDPVHDSFYGYIAEAEKRCAAMTAVTERFGQLCESLEHIDAHALSDECGMLEDML